MVEGRGVAALTAALLLSRSGVTCSLTGPDPAPGPVLLLHPGTLSLLKQVWALAPADLPALHRVRLRAVKPLPPDEPALLEQPSVVIGSETLTATLRQRLEAAFPKVLTGSSAGAEASRWRLTASGRTAPGTLADTSICAMAEIAPSRHFLPDRAIFEALPGGWLFLLPLGESRALLQAQREAADCQDPLEANLAESQIMPRLIGSVSGERQTFQATPRLAEPCTGENWLAIGGAAMALPPVTGDGVGNGIRTAIWAVASLRAIQRGEPPGPVREFYAWRLRQAFNRMAEHTGTPSAPEPDPTYEPPYRLDGLDLLPQK